MITLQIIVTLLMLAPYFLMAKHVNQLIVKHNAEIETIDLYIEECMDDQEYKELEYEKYLIDYDM